MPTLTRRRSTDAREECWHIYCGDVQAGTIALRSGIPYDEDPWEWHCGFYPGSHPGEHQSGTAATFDEARADFETGLANISFEPNRSRFSGLARCAGLDRAEICHVGSWREISVAEAQLPDALPMRRGLR